MYFPIKDAGTKTLPPFYKLWAPAKTTRVDVPLGRTHPVCLARAGSVDGKTLGALGPFRMKAEVMKSLRECATTLDETMSTTPFHSSPRGLHKCVFIPADEITGHQLDKRRGLDFSKKKKKRKE